MRTPLIVGNWKMHKTLAEARELVGGIRDAIAGITGVDVLICPPYQHLFPIARAVADTPIMFGAQNAHSDSHGAFTGEVSVPMIADTGATHVIIGHSERRQYFHENGEQLAKKVRAVIAGGLNVIFCLGESLEQRESGQMERVVTRQLDEVIAGDVDASRLTIAYEPVWAIGTGKTAKPDQAQEVHALIRARLGLIYSKSTAGEIRILYGGSVKPGNAEELLALPDVDGALVGGACLVASDFAAIISAAAKIPAST